MPNNAPSPKKHVCRENAYRTLRKGTVILTWDKLCEKNPPRYNAMVPPANNCDAFIFVTGDARRRKQVQYVVRLDITGKTRS